MRSAVGGAMLLAAATAAAQTPGPSSRRYASSPVDTAHGDREFVLLWPDGAPGAVGTEPEDKPKLTLYRARADRASGAAIVVCPGGGYRTLASDHEGRQVAEWLNGLGVSAFVLQYRVGPRYRHPAPITDAQRALRLVRFHAREWGVDPARVGIMGFSAGGHLASTAGTRFDDGDPQAADPVDRLGSRPDLMILAYPVISFTAPFTHSGSRQSLLGDSPDPKLAEELSNELRVTARTPPTFLFHTGDDAGVPVENSIAFYQALRAARVPAELHVFSNGPHGVGLAPQDPVLSQWPKLCAVWLQTMGFLEPRPAVPGGSAMRLTFDTSGSRLRSYRMSIAGGIPSANPNAKPPRCAASRYARSPHPEGTFRRRPARARRIAPHRADHRRHVRRATGLTLPCAPSSGGSWLAHVRLAAFRE